jgi:cytochrome P450
VSSFPFGPRRFILVDDAALIEQILVARQHEFVRDSGAVVLRELVGEGLLTTDDPAHIARRRTMQPAFHRARVAGYADTIVSETERVIAGWSSGARLDVGAEMARLALAAVGAALFGADLHGEARAIADVLAGVVRRGRSLGVMLAFGTPFLGPLHRLFPRRESLLFPNERAELERIAAPLVASRRERRTGDLLSMLLEARAEDGSTLDDAAVQNEAVMLILAGHETTANALTWTWYLLSRHPEVERRLYDEVDRALAGRAPRFEDLPRLGYVGQVFDEALRLYPPAAAFARRPLQTIALGGYTIPRLASVFVSPYVTGRNPRYFERPLEYRPERWETPPKKFAFFPFGGGSKMCIGEPFARMEAVLALATIASRFRLQRHDRSLLAPAPQELLKPNRPLVMEAIARAPVAH